MRQVDSEEWEALKRRSARRLADPHWLGGMYRITPTELVDRTEHTTLHVVPTERAQGGSRFSL